jgi:hypothetical protein
MGRRSIKQERRLAADLRRQTQIRKSGGDFSDAHGSSKIMMIRVAPWFLPKKAMSGASCIDTGGEAGLRAEPPDIGAEESHHIVKS